MKNETKFDYDKRKPIKSEFGLQKKCPKHDIINEEEGDCFSSNEDLASSNSNRIKNKTEEQEGVVELLETEVIIPDQHQIPKEANKPFSYQYLQSKLDSCKESITEDIVSSVGNALKAILNTAHANIINDNLQVRSSQKNHTQIMPSIPTMPNQVEGSLKLKTIKELKSHQSRLQSKLSQIEDKVTFLQLKPLDNNADCISSNIIESNIKKDQVKGLQETKTYVSAKIQGIEDQINKLLYEIANESENASEIKSQNIKKFLANFNQDQDQIEEKVNRYEMEKQNREMKITALLSKSKEKKGKELDEIERAKEEALKNKLVSNRIKEREKILQRLSENNSKVANMKTYANGHPDNSESEYLFKTLEKKYIVKNEQEVYNELAKRKQNTTKHTYTKEELNEFTFKQKEREKLREAEIEEDKRKLKEQWKKANEQLPKYEPLIKHKLKQEEQKNQEEKELEEMNKKLLQEDMKNYSQTVNKMYLPKIDDKVKKQREEQILGLIAKNNNAKHVRKHKRILLVKPDPSKPSKYNWDLKLEVEQKSKERNPLKKSRSSSAKQRRPLPKPIDYLKEMRINKEKTSTTTEKAVRPQRQNNQWIKILNNHNNNFHENIEMIKIKAQQLEEKAKMAEQLIKANKGEPNVELNKNASNMLIDAIKAKLAILGNINKN